MGLGGSGFLAALRGVSDVRALRPGSGASPNVPHEPELSKGADMEHESAGRRRALLGEGAEDAPRRRSDATTSAGRHPVGRRILLRLCLGTTRLSDGMRVVTSACFIRCDHYGHLGVTSGTQPLRSSIHCSHGRLLHPLHEWHHTDAEVSDPYGAIGPGRVQRSPWPPVRGSSPDEHVPQNDGARNLEVLGSGDQD